MKKKTIKIATIKNKKKRYWVSDVGRKSKDKTTKAWAVVNSIYGLNHYNNGNEFQYPIFRTKKDATNWRIRQIAHIKFWAYNSLHTGDNYECIPCEIKITK